MPTLAAIGLAIAVTAAGVGWNTQTAGGADAYGYVSQAALWRAGTLHVDHAFALAEQAGLSLEPAGARFRTRRYHTR